MLEFTPRLRNICMICFLIFVFVFLIVNAWMYRNNPIENFENKETNYYDCDTIQKTIDEGTFQGNPANLIPCTPKLTPHDGWFNRFDGEDNRNAWRDTDGRSVTTLKTKITNDKGEETEVDIDGSHILKLDSIKSINGSPIRTDSMTIGFWIYLNKSMLHTWRPIINFGSAQNEWWISERSPGIWIWPWFRNALHIRNSTDGPPLIWNHEHNSGGDFFTENLNNIPFRKPAYVSIVFSERVYKIFINGVHIQTWENTYAQKDDRVIDNSDRTDVKRNQKQIWLGSWSWDNTFFLKKVEIFPTPLTDDENRLLYCKNKQEASEDPEFNTSELSREGFKGFRKGRFGIGRLSSPITQTKQNEFHIGSNEVQFKSDVENQESIASQQELQNAIPTGDSNEPSMEEKETLPNGIVVHSCKLDKFDFPKLHTTKQLKYVHFQSKKKEYLKWNKDFDLKDAPGVTFMCWYRPTHMKAVNFSQEEIDQNYKQSRKEGEENVKKGERFWQANSWDPIRNSWFSKDGSKRYHEYNSNWVRLFDFGNGPGKENIVTAFYGKSLTTHVVAPNPDNKTRYTFWNHPMAAEGNHWYHFAVTMDRASSTWTFYINGMPYSYTSGENGKHYNMIFPTDGTRTNQYIGKSNWGNDAYYDGDIGDFRIYKHAFTEDEIQTAMNELEDSMENSDNQFRGFG